MSALEYAVSGSITLNVVLITYLCISRLGARKLKQALNTEKSINIVMTKAVSELSEGPLQESHK
jgi:hypothetical protein